MNFEYKINAPISAAQFVDVLKRSGLGVRRTSDYLACIDGVVSNSNLIVTAWAGDQLIGVARSVTDFHYACYLSDLVVCRSHQKLGVGKQLQMLTQKELGPRCKLILIAAPAANEYYGQIGYINNPRCWVLERVSLIR